MPFQSKAQRRYLFSQHPDIAKRWAREFPEEDEKLPEYKKPQKKFSLVRKALRNVR